MKISESALTIMTGEGRLTLQIPWINTGKIIEIPDDWVCNLSIALSPSQAGQLFFTRKGYEANKEKLKKSFEQYFTTKQEIKGWSAFEKHAEEHFIRVELQRQKLLEKLTKELIEISNFVV